MPGDDRPTRLPRRALIGVGAAVVVMAATLALVGGNTVEVYADGDLQEVSLARGTVAEALELAEVDLAGGDVVTPSTDTEVEDGLRVVVTREIGVQVIVDDEDPMVVTAAVTSVGGLLRAAGLEDVRDGGAVVTPAWREAVVDGDVIRIQHPAEVSVEVDGEEFTVVTLASQVEDVLRLNDVEVGPDDLVEPAPSAAINGGTAVVIQRVEYVEEVEETVLEHEEVRRETSEMERGTTAVDQEGSDGLQVDTYRVMLVDGEETERERIDREVTDPRERVVLVGTAAPPPPPEPEPEPEPSTSASSGSSSSGSSSSSTSSSDSSSSGSSSSTSTSSGVPAMDDPVWDRLAACESNGNWQANTGNGFYGGLQFRLETWRGVGGSGMPHEASREEQIRRARILLEPDQPWATFSHQFPHCSSVLGLS